MTFELWSLIAMGFFSYGPGVYTRPCQSERKQPDSH